jgi:hypothetical protein
MIEQHVQAHVAETTAGLTFPLSLDTIVSPYADSHDGRYGQRPFHGVYKGDPNTLGQAFLK